MAVDRQVPFLTAMNKAFFNGGVIVWCDGAVLHLASVLRAAGRSGTSWLGLRPPVWISMAVLLALTLLGWRCRVLLGSTLAMVSRVTTLVTAVRMSGRANIRG